MTVSALADLNDLLVSYAGDGSTKAFAYPHRFFEDSDLVVEIKDSAGAITPRLLTSHYTVSGAGDPSGGTVTFLTAPASGETVYIVRDTTIRQNVDYVDGQKLIAGTIEDNVDRFALIAQDYGRQIGRAMRLPTDVSGVDPVLPSPQAGSPIVWGTAGNSLENGPAPVVGEYLLFDGAGRLATGAAAFSVTSSEGHFASVADAANAEVPLDRRWLHTEFFSPLYAVPATLTGGASYRRMSKADIDAAGYPARAYFRSQDRGMPDGTTDATNGGYWVLNEKIVLDQMLGSRVDGTTDDAVALQAAVDYSIIEGATWFLTPGVRATSTKITVTGPTRIMGAGMFLAEIKATAAMTSVLEWSPAANGFLILTDLQLNGDNFATDCFTQTMGLVQGSTLGRLRLLNPVSKGWACKSFIYAMDVSQIICNGGQYGLHVEGNGPTNGATFIGFRASNTTVAAVHIKNTALSTSTCTFLSPTIEGNDGKAFYANTVRVRIYAPWFETNGRVTGDPDINLESHGSVTTQVKIYEPNFSTKGAAQTNVRAQILSAQCQLALYGGNQSASAFTIDANSHTSGCRVDLMDNASAALANAALLAVRRDGIGYKKFGRIALGTTATPTGIAADSNGWVEVTATRRSSSAVEAAKYLVSLDNSGGIINAGYIGPALPATGFADFVTFSVSAGGELMATRTGGTSDGWMTFEGEWREF